MHTIILTEPKRYSETAIALLKTIGSVHAWEEARGKKKLLEKADIIVVKLSVHISKEVMSCLPSLKIIATSTTGLNHIDCAEAERRGIHIVSLRGETFFLKKITPTAEETIGLMIALMRNIPWGFESLKKGEWVREPFYGKELYGRTLGIVGFGRLGSIVARYAKAFGMQVIAHDPYVAEGVMKQKGVQKVSMRDAFQKADILSLHVLLTEKTENLITKQHLRLMKRGAYLINTARGELIDERALLEALQRQWIAGAALDVLRGEDPAGKHVKNNPLLAYARTHKNLLIVPHLGGASFDAMARTEDFIAKKILKQVRK